jgi:putative salt-induced outer membrane protein YdiY
MKFLILLMLSIVSAEAVVTITSVDIGAKPGMSGTLKGSFQTKRGNTDSDEYSAATRIEYDNNSSYVVWTDVSFSYAKASGASYTNKTYAHIRYIHKLYKENLDWEAFVQSQADKFTKIQKRLLSGIGLRYHLIMKNYGSFYLGVGGFAEHINYTTSIDPSEDNTRANVYIAYKKAFKKDMTFSYVAYCQPKIDMLSDYILSNSIELKVKIYKQLSLNFEVTYDQDSKPAIGVQKYDFYQKTSFMYDF